jgi:tetratricopeptide (TPR) repeat protein
MKSLKLFILVGFISLSLAGCGSSEPSSVVVLDPDQDYQAANQLVQEEKFDEAVELIGKYRDVLADSLDADSRDWLGLLIQAEFGRQNIRELIQLYRHFPGAFNEHEEASLLVGSGFLAGRMLQEFDDIRLDWQGKETLHPRWLVADADRLVLEGKREEAIKLLKQEAFPGEEDTGRLVRLALLEGQGSNRTAWEHLTEASQKDQDNPEIRILRARLLENLGRFELAQIEYTAAARLNPEDSRLRDMLADFFIRRRQYVPALQTWAYGLAEPSSDIIWAKAIFWQSVTQLMSAKLFTDNPIPEGELKPLVEYMLALPADKWWDAEAFQEIENGNTLLQTQQLTYWLRLMQTLIDGNEKEALSLIEFNQFRPVSWCPELETNLHRVLLFRQTGSFSIIGSDVKQESTESTVAINKQKEQQHLFFNELDSLVAELAENPTKRLDAELIDFLTGDEAIAAVFYAAGWLEAGLQMHRLDVLPASYPEWVSYAVAQSLRYNRGSDAALSFIKKQHSTPALQMLEGELLVATGDIDAGVLRLAEAAHAPGQLGFQSAWRLVLVHIDQKQFREGEQVLNEHREFARTVTGRELRARLALLSGREQEAKRLYGAIANESTEAKSYLARLAYQNEDWIRAKELTEDLLREHPSSLPLRANLNRILQKLQDQEAAQ